MNSKNPTSLEAYRTKLQEAQDLADAAAKEMRQQAKDMMAELKRISFEYQKLTGSSLPETQALYGKAPAADAAPTKKRTRSTRGKLGGEYEGLTLPAAIVKALKAAGKEGMKAGDLADEIGGQRPSVAVALSNMYKAGEIARLERGVYAAK